MREIIEESLKKAISYTAYRNLVNKLVAQGKSTAPEQSEDLTNYSLLNDRRMKRLDNTLELSEKTIKEIKTLNKPQTWLIIAESWCADVAQNLPIINKMAKINENIQLKIVLRDDNLKLMDLFLTNGGRAIPKLIILESDNKLINTWGPRPSIASKMVADYKEKHGHLDTKFKQDIQVWYNKNKGENIQDDFVNIVKNA